MLQRPGTPGMSTATAEGAVRAATSVIAILAARGDSMARISRRLSVYARSNVVMAARHSSRPEGAVEDGALVSPTSPPTQDGQRLEPVVAAPVSRRFTPPHREMRVFLLGPPCYPAPAGPPASLRACPP